MLKNRFNQETIVMIMLTIMGIGLIAQIIRSENQPLPTIPETAIAYHSYRTDYTVFETVEASSEEVAADEDNTEDIELLARLIYAEAGSVKCTYEMRYLVGSVVINRVESKYFPNSIEEVIYQRGQYACITDGHINNQPTEECYQIAKDLLENGTTAPETVLYQAEFKQGSGVYQKIQNMYFCYR